MNIFEKAIWKIDEFQRRHKPASFTFAVIKKHNDDQAGYQAALVTYYAFFSLFPLLLVLTTLAGLIGRHHQELGTDLVKSVSSYFPVVGQSLDRSVKGISKTGPALIIGLLFTLYGARGVADAFRNAVNHVWHVPLAGRSGFPRSWIRSFSLIFIGGFGFLSAAIIAGWTASAGQGFEFKLLSVACNLVVLYVVFVLLLRLSLPLSVPVRKFRAGAAICAVGLAMLQTLGGYILLHQAKHLSDSYSALVATTLGLMAWIYLQVQVVMYAVVVDTVRDGKLWPRSLSGKRLTGADRKMNETRIRFVR
jgi:membrane protein